MERTERVKRALANPLYFAEAYVRPFDPNWKDDLPPFAGSMLRHVLANQRSVVVLPPEFLKTTLLSQVLPLWLTVKAVYFDFQLRGMLMSEEEGMAAGNLAVLQWHVVNNEYLARDFCDDRGAPLIVPSPDEQVWREDAMVVRRSHPSRDPTWQAKGLDSKGVHGRRLDWYIGDDVVTPRNAHSPAMRKRALDTFDLQVETRLVADHHAVLAGNFNDPKDLLSTVGTRKRWSEFRRPSCHVPGDPAQAPRESDLRAGAFVPLWPQVWPADRLLVEYEDKPNRFRRIHLLDPRAEHGERLQVGWVQRVQPEATPLQQCKWFIGVDPAAGGETEDLDYMNITVCGLHAHLDLVQTLDVRAPLGRQGQLLGVLHDTYNRMGLGVTAIGAPKGAMDNYFRDAFKMARPDLAHKLEPMPQPGNKQDRLEGLGPYAQTGWLRVWEPAWDLLTSDDADQLQELSLYEQWRDFPYINHDDKLDGLWLTIKTAEQFSVVGDGDFSLTVAD